MSRTFVTSVQAAKECVSWTGQRRSRPSVKIHACARTYMVDQKIGTIFVRHNFTKYLPIFKIISLSESGENL